jgi:hypothetical protein
LIAAFEEDTRWQSYLPSYVPELPPKLGWKPRVVKIERLKGFWDDYRELVASGHYEQGWWESISYGFASAILPSSEPSTKITFDDGTVLIVLGGGPDSGALAGQATVILGVYGAAANAPTLWQAVFSAFKHLGRETAETIADNVVQEVTGSPIGPSSLLPRKGKAPKRRGRARRLKPRRTKKARRKPVDAGRGKKTHPSIEGTLDAPRTPEHKFLQKTVAEEMQADGSYVRVGVGRPLSEFSGLKHSPDIRPDNVGLTREGRIDMFEILSPSQTKDELVAKLEKAMNQLPPEMRGGFRVVDPGDAFK